MGKTKLFNIFICILFLACSCNQKADFNFKQESIVEQLKNGKSKVFIEVTGDTKGLVWNIPEESDKARCLKVPSERCIELEFYKEGKYEIKAKVEGVEKSCLVEIKQEAENEE